MMVKDEGKNIRRCLDALKPLLQKPDVELIVVDTGSKDNTPGIVSEYTDKLYFHPWTDHFSHMRNITISYAKGEYIFILDADEVIENPCELYELIHDSRLAEFNTYIVKIKNLTVNGSYTILPQERVFRNDGQFRYEGAVHNQPKYKPPLLNTDIYLVHYGYLFNDKELKEKKFIRTGGILKRELEKDPDNPYYRYQLARSYLAHEDYELALGEIRKAYSLIKNDDKKLKMYAYIFCTYGNICLANKEYQEAYNISRIGVKYISDYVDLYFIMAYSSLFLNRKKEATEDYQKYLELAENYGNLDISANGALEMYYIHEGYRDRAAAFLANEYYNAGSYEESYKYAVRIHDETARCQLITKLLVKQGKYSELLDIYSKYTDDRNSAELIAGIIEKEKEEISPADKRELEKLFSTGKDCYSVLNRIRCGGTDNKWKLISDSFGDVDINELPSFYADLFSDIDTDTRRVLTYFKKLRKEKIREYVKRLMEKNSGLGEFFESFLLNAEIRDNDFNSLRVCTGIAYILLINEAAVIRNTKTDVPDKLYAIFKLYIERGIKYVNMLYNPERMRLYYSSLSDQEDLFFIALQYSALSIQSGDIKAGLKYFREAARANPYMACYMNRYKDELNSIPTADETEDSIID